MSLKLNGSSAGSVSFDAPSDTSPSGTDVTLTLPTSAGSAGQYLRNSSTAGALEFGDLPTLGFTSTAATATTSGSSHTVTGLSTNATLHMVCMSGVSSDTSTPQLLFQIGNGSLSSTGYYWSVGYTAGTDQTASNTSSVRLTHTAFYSASNAYSGIIYICCDSGDSVTGNWIFETVNGSSSIGGFRWSGDTAIDRFSLQSAGTFDAGSFKIHSR